MLAIQPQPQASGASHPARVVKSLLPQKHPPQEITTTCSTDPSHPLNLQKPTPRCNTHTALNAPPPAESALPGKLENPPTATPAVHIAVTADPPAVRIATAADASFVCDLQRRFSNELGFLPHMAVDWYIDNGRVLLRQLNGQHAGYLLGRSHLRCQPWVAPLTQTAISFDAQLRDLGRGLVEHAAVTAAADGRSILQAWCRVDLDANEFWRAMGFTAVGIRRPDNQRQQPLLLWRRPLTELGRSRLLILPTAAGFRAVTSEQRRLLTPADRQRFLTGRSAA